MGNYHPLTILLMSATYQLFGLSPDGFHSVNLLLHLLNTALVFFVIRNLSRRDNIALVAALLFGIHPIHVESVAWAAELKDLLYTFFFLASYRVYLSYVNKPGAWQYLFCLFLFGQAMLTNAMAASLPVDVLLTEFFLRRKFSWSVVLEKIPFVLLAVGLGIVAVIAQKTQSNPAEYVFPFTDRILYAGASFLEYLGKLLLPMHLYAHYAYPVLSGQPVPGQIILYCVLSVLIVAFAIYSLRRGRTFFFGLAFFAITIFLVLQLLPVGGARMADRYAYVPSIGIFFLAGAGMAWLIQRKQATAAWSLLAVCTIFFCYRTFAQSKTWKNDLSLWNDVIRQDQGSGVAYNNRAMVYMKSDSVKALDDFTKAIAINPRYGLSLFNRGVLYAGMKRNEEAIADYTAAIHLDPGYTEAFINRGNVRMDIGQYTGARNDYDSAIALSPSFARAFNNRGLLSMKELKNKEAIADFDKAIEFNPGYEKALLNKGNAEMNEKMYTVAKVSYSRLLDLNGGIAEAYYNRAWAFFLTNDTPSACKDLQRAQAMGYRISDDALSRACKP